LAGTQKRLTLPKIPLSLKFTERAAQRLHFFVHRCRVTQRLRVEAKPLTKRKKIAAKSPGLASKAA